MLYPLSIATMMLRKKQYCNKQNLSGTLIQIYVSLEFVEFS